MGLLTIAKILIELGYEKMFLANISEGIEIRKKYKSIELYILNCGKPLNSTVFKKI